jgi:hypothetical protein
MLMMCIILSTHVTHALSIAKSSVLQPQGFDSWMGPNLCFVNDTYFMCLLHPWGHLSVVEYHILCCHWILDFSIRYAEQDFFHYIW